MHKHLHKVKSHIVAHKIISALVLFVLLYSGYWGYKKATSTEDDIRYITAIIKRGTMVTSISGSGQVSSLNQIDIKSKVSGDVVYVKSKNGDLVGTGELIAQINAKDAERSVRDGEVNLESAQITLQKLRIEKSNENLNADLVKSYDDGFNTISNVFLHLPGIITGLDNIFFKANVGTGQWNVDWYEAQVGSNDREKAKIFKQNFVDSYAQAKIAYDKNFDDYKTISRSFAGEVIEKLIWHTYETTKLISDAVKSANNYIDFVKDSMQRNNFDIPIMITTHKTSLSTYTAETNTDLINLLSAKTNVKDSKDAFANSDLDIQSSLLLVKQKGNALQDAKDKLADYLIRAPFEGTVAKMDIKHRDTVSAGAVVATLITKKQLAEISLNEVDAAKIQIGQKTNLSFDAITDLTISGMVADLDAIGTVSQGVVTYLAKISFDAQDERVKPGMSVSGIIITDTKENILIVPNSAVKSTLNRQTETGNNYIELSDLTKISVEVGLSNDTQSEIISGIKEGTEIIVRTILPSAKANNSAPSIFGSSSVPKRNSGNGGAEKFQAR